jgi:hypothetical protein
MKIDWKGDITSVQPRFRLMRSFDERHHTYLGYALRICGEIDGENGEASGSQRMGRRMAARTGKIEFN